MRELSQSMPKRRARLPGVLAVLTGAEADEDRLGGLPWEVRPPVPKGTDETALPPMGSPEVATPQPVIARDIVRYVGEIVAMVVAETKHARAMQPSAS